MASLVQQSGWYQFPPRYAVLRHRASQLSDNWTMQEAVTRDPEVMHGTPVFRGTRVPVKTLFDYLEKGESLARRLPCRLPNRKPRTRRSGLEESKELRLARV